MNGRAHTWFMLFENRIVCNVFKFFFFFFSLHDFMLAKVVDETKGAFACREEAKI